MMPSDLKELLRAFNDHSVKYIVVAAMPSAYMPNRAPQKTWMSSSDRTKRTAKQFFVPSRNTARRLTV